MPHFQTRDAVLSPMDDLPPLRYNIERDRVVEERPTSQSDSACVTPCSAGCTGLSEDCGGKNTLDAAQRDFSKIAGLFEIPETLSACHGVVVVSC